MNQDIQLSDMLESYPSNSIPHFQTMITSKKEFAELASDPNERLPRGRGQFYKHQKFTHRFLRAYDDLFSISETGSGKSLETLGFTEYTRRELEKAKIDPAGADEKAAHFKRVVVLVKGPTQKNEFKHQLVCKASDGRYETVAVKKEEKEAQQKTYVTNEIKKAGYIITTYRSFANRIMEKYPITDEGNERLAEDWSDTIFWIDEAHNLILDPGARVTNREKEQTYRTLWRVFHLARRCKRIISTATPMINDENEIGFLLNLLLPLDGMLPAGFDYKNASDNDIRVLFPDLPFDHKTATPEEIAPYFRGQLPRNYNFTDAGLEDLEPYLRGKIGFVRALDTGAVPVEQGIPYTRELTVGGEQYESQLTIYATEMSEFQSNSYLHAKHTEHNIEGMQQADLFSDERQASNFVFPDGFWGNGITDEERATRRRERQGRKAPVEAPAPITLRPTEQAPIQLGDTLDVDLDDPAIYNDVDAEVDYTGVQTRAFRRYVTHNGDNYFANPEFRQWLTSLETIRNLSCKYAEIVRLLITDPGNAFVYGEYVAGSGVIVLALCLEGMGFVRYNESLSMFTGIGETKAKPYCAEEITGANPVINRRVRPDILSRQQGAPPRYALLTRETSNAKFYSMMEAMNSYENRHGDYIKVLISSRVGRDGINVNNVLSIHLLGSEWNASAIYQALSRGIRSTSHEDLLNEERARIQAEGGDPADAYIPIKVYKHAAVARDEDQSSIDLNMYRVAEYKDRKIKRIMRMLKQCAVGCQVHYNRNVRETDIDYSATCDYDICRYPCVDPAPDFMDYSTYDVLYAREVIVGAIRDIENTFRQLNIITLDKLATLLPDYRVKYLIMALEHLITNKMPLTDRFGYTSYLREDHGSFYLDRSYPAGVSTSSSMSYYTQGIIAIEHTSLSEIVNKREAGAYQEIISELQVLNPEDPSFGSRLESLSIEAQASVLEDAILQEINGNKTPFTDAILVKYHQVTFVIREPVADLNEQIRQSQKKEPKRGRKANPNTKKRIKKINIYNIDPNDLVVDETAPWVYIHTLYSLIDKQTKYDATARFNKGEGRTRILNTEKLDHGWRDLNDTELQIYSKYIQVELAKRRSNLEQLGLYGFILPDKKFRIRDRDAESKEAVTDARKIKRGKTCENWDKPDLIDIMYKIGVPEAPGYFPVFTPDDTEFIIDTLLQSGNKLSRAELRTWSFEKLVYYYKWYTIKQYEGRKIHRSILCDLIRTRMTETGRILEV